MELFTQVLCFLFDGTSRHVSYFDDLARDPGCADVLETEPERLAWVIPVPNFTLLSG